MKEIIYAADGITVENVTLVEDGLPDDLYVGPGMVRVCDDPLTFAYPPEPPAPLADVSPRQMKLALLAAGLLDQVEAFVAQAPRAVQITWEYATVWQRDDAMLNQMAVAFGMSSDQVDGLFRAAAGM